MSEFEEERVLALAALAPLPGWGRSPTIEPAFPVLASPGWHGVDGTHWTARSADGRMAHVKVMHADAAWHVDIAVAFRAATRAAEIGVGPEVLSADADRGVLVLAQEPGWLTGTLDRLYDRATNLKVLAARKAFQDTAPLGRVVSVFDEIRTLRARCDETGAALPADAPWLFDNIDAAERAILAAGVATVPAHGDGTSSNVLLGPDGQVLLVDWDRAADMDHYADLGSHLVETCPQEPEARLLFEAHEGCMDEGRFARTMLYGTADDVRWGLIGSLLAKVTTRPSLEFLKFANWRWLRARLAVRDPRYSERLRRVA